jgi:hypothetical protein
LGLAGQPVLRDFSVVAAHLLSNPNVDGDLATWTTVVAGRALIDVDPQDAGEAPSSASAQIIAGSEDAGALQQCHSVEPGLPILLGGLAFAKHGSAVITVLADSFPEPECGGELTTLGSRTTAVGAGQGWVALGALEATPQSGFVRATYAVEPSTGGIVEVLLDDLVFRVVHELFADGFESGDTTAWSSSTP